MDLKGESGLFNKIFRQIIVVAVALAFTVSCTADRDIAGEYAFEDIVYRDILSSTFWPKESREQIRYIIDKDHFSIAGGAHRRWPNVSYTREAVDSAFVQDSYGDEFLTKRYIELFFAKSSTGHRYVILDENNEEIGYHVFQIGEDTYVGETYADYQKRGFLKIEKVKKVK